MKKIILLLLAFSLGLSSFASDETEIKQFFNSFVDAGNTYRSDYFNFYSETPRIERIVIKKDGSKKSVIVPISEFKKHSKLNMKLGKLRRYKNYYSNIQIASVGEDYKISTMRRPSTSDYSLPAHFIVGKDKNGHWKIKEESMQTKVQTFLKEKS